ncbi:unnamed protein product [Onchocerca flexuosa]|uniref:TMhelix containing protein n=1 Tax=Onchocerca flexuosa TaxID=387005 RepID=A0A183HPX6_9BILA|nr:unnamed protein product [Onchocerca flexuosa]
MGKSAKKKAANCAKEERKREVVEEKSNLWTKCWIFTVALIGSCCSYLTLIY